MDRSSWRRSTSGTSINPSPVVSGRCERSISAITAIELGSISGCACIRTGPSCPDHDQGPASGLRDKRTTTTRTSLIYTVSRDVDSARDHIALKAAWNLDMIVEIGVDRAKRRALMPRTGRDPRSKRGAGQPSWSKMRRALASIRFSPADRPRLASRPARSRTTSTTWTRSPDASFSRFALYRCDQVRPSSPPLSTVTPQPISKLPGSRSRGPKLVSRMTAIGRTHIAAMGAIVSCQLMRSLVSQMIRSSSIVTCMPLLRGR